MSAHDAHDHAHDHESGAAHATLSGYLVGFGLSVVLTAIPFWLVMNGVIESKTTTAILIMGLAAIQIVVHMIYFLHMTPQSENGWTLLAAIFTAVIVFITLSGSLWVMYHLTSNMMPGHGMGGM